MACNLIMSAIASALLEAFNRELFGNPCTKDTHPHFLALSTDPLLVWNYGSMGVLAAVAGIFFWISFIQLDKDEDKLNNLDEGRLGVKEKV